MVQMKLLSYEMPNVGPIRWAVLITISLEKDIHVQGGMMGGVHWPHCKVVAF